MVSNIHNSTSLFRWSKIIRHSDNQGQKLPSSKIWFFDQLWLKLALLTTQFSWQQKQIGQAPVFHCSSYMVLLMQDC